MDYKIMEVRNREGDRWQRRMALGTDSLGNCVCVSEPDEDAFKAGMHYNTIKWNYSREVEEATMSDRDFIHLLSKIFEEKRSDVAEMCKAHLRGESIANIKDECRYIRGDIPGTNIQVEYDTLSNMLEYHKIGEQWEFCSNIKYYDVEEV